MAKLYTRRKGKSKSRKPVIDRAEFGKGTSETSKEEIEQIILNYAKEGTSPALIGEKLKANNNVKYIQHALGKRLVTFLNENNIKSSVPQDLLDLIRKAVKIRKHIENNKGDVHNKTALSRTEAKIWRLTRYYTREGVLPSNWKYNPKTAELLIKGKL